MSCQHSPSVRMPQTELPVYCDWGEGSGLEVFDKPCMVEAGNSVVVLVMVIVVVVVVVMVVMVMVIVVVVVMVVMVVVVMVVMVMMVVVVMVMIVVVLVRMVVVVIVLLHEPNEAVVVGQLMLNQIY